MNEFSFAALKPQRTAALPLARRGDFSLGQAKVRPSLRTVEGPLGSAKGEPRVIQVLVALADAQGGVLSREELLQLCWDGRIVGDDAINRAIGEVRRIAATTGAGFEVETVPRIGYRITGVDWGGTPAETGVGPRRIDRRVVLGGAAATVAAVAGAGFLAARRSDAQVSALIERGKKLRASGMPGSRGMAKALFRKATEIDPTRAEAWGWIAVTNGNSDEESNADDEARLAAERAIALDPREPNARAALTFLRRDLDDWISYENGLLAILRDAPDCAPALGYLTLFLQSVGRCRDSLASNERAIALEPFSPQHQARRALKHWIFGRIADADKVADRLLQLSPRNSTAWNARLIIYAFTGRPLAALALLDDVASRPATLKSPSIEAWRSSLTALATGARNDIDRAIAVNTRAATLAPGLAANAIMAFSSLGQLDAAYEVADGLLTNRGPLVQRAREVARTNALYSSPVWGRTQFLFIPAIAAFRADARFTDLCRRMGHIEYWRRRGIWPDAFVRGSLYPG